MSTDFMCRQFLTVGILGLLSTAFLPAVIRAQDSSPEFKVTLLGTGTPILSADRFGPSTLVVAGNQTLLFDAGRGATIRMAQAGVPPSRLDVVFLTHLHSDHVNGLTDVWLTGWIPAGGRRTQLLRVVGLKGTQDMMQHLSLAHRADIEMRIADQHLPREGAAVEGVDMQTGVVYERDGVTVTAFDVDHGEALKPAFGFRIEYAEHSVAISGDTRFSDNLINHAKGVGLLIHEVAAAQAGYAAANPTWQLILAHHTSPEEAGKVFSMVQPQLAVYSHKALFGDSSWPAPSEAELVRETRNTYSGAPEVGHDLMSIDVISGTVQQPR